MATLLGRRLLDRHAAGEPVDLLAAFRAGWITRAEYETATST